MFAQSTNLFESICGKMFSWKVVYGWMDKITKKRENTIYLKSAVYQHKNNLSG